MAWTHVGTMIAGPAGSWRRLGYRWEGVDPKADLAARPPARSDRRLGGGRAGRLLWLEWLRSRSVGVTHGPPLPGESIADGDRHRIARADDCAAADPDADERP